MAYKIQKGQVEGLREALLELAEDISQTGVDLATSINDVISSLTTLINSTGNYLDNKIDDVDNTLTANLELTGLSVQNQINLLPDQTDYNNLDSRLDDHDTKIHLMSGKISHLSGVVSGLKDFEESVALGEFDVMPLTGSGDLVVANGFKHRVYDTFSISGYALELYGQNVILQSTFNGIQILPADDLLISGNSNSVTEIRSGPTGYFMFANNTLYGSQTEGINLAGTGVFDFAVGKGGMVLTANGEDVGGSAFFDLGPSGIIDFDIGEGGGISLSNTWGNHAGRMAVNGALEIESNYGDLSFSSYENMNLTTFSGDIEISASDGYGDNPSAGNINLIADGNVDIRALGEIKLSLPTSDPLVSRALWRSGKYVMISP